MIDLPNGMPMYTKDLKQILDHKAERLSRNKNGLPSYKDESKLFSGNKESFEQCLIWIKKHPAYPKQENEHNAIADARWNKKLHEILENI